MSVRLETTHDARRIAALHAAQLAEARGVCGHSSDDIVRLWSGIPGAWFVIANDVTPVGFASLIAKDGWPYLSDLYVQPGHRRRGVARLMLGAVLAERSDVRLHVAVGHAAAIALYRSMGFLVIAEEGDQLMMGRVTSNRTIMMDGDAHIAGDDHG